MPETPTEEQFRTGLRHADLKGHDHDVLSLFLHAPGHALTATEIAAGLGVEGHDYGNLRIGTLGSALADAMSFSPNLRQSDGSPMYWNVVAKGHHRDSDGHFEFTMHQALVEAISSFDNRSDRAKRLDFSRTPPQDLPELTDEQLNRIADRRTERRRDR